MKKKLFGVLLLFTVILLSAPKTFAWSGIYNPRATYNSGAHYKDGGIIWTNVQTPKDAAKSINGDKPVDFRDLRCGEASARNILYLIEIGDASVTAAARNAGIKKIKFVDTKTCKIFVPLGFIPIMVRETKTLVYGE